jgi:hypothetical protein
MATIKDWKYRKNQNFMDKEQFNEEEKGKKRGKANRK